MRELSRREVVQGIGAVGLGLLAGCGRWPWQAPAPARVPRIGVVTAAEAIDPINEALRQGLQELGYIDGQNAVVEWRFTGGRLDPYPDLVGELVRLPVDVIVVQGTAGSRAAKQATSTVPIVMAFTNDPVRAGVVASLARPGGNVTGLASIAAELSGKRLQLLQDTVPSLARVAMLWNPAIADRAHEFEETEAAARVLGVDLQSVEVREANDFERAFEAVLRGRADALFLQDNDALDRNRPRIADFAAAHGLPAMSIRGEFVAAGTLMSYGANIADMNRRAATYVDKILKGAKPADLPVEQPMRFDFVINLKTAQALGLSIPHHVLLQATEVIQ
jgi:putative tryptophan/tyrosine transport system substrate-binding protein